MPRAEVVNARSGAPVLKWDGRYLGSAIDPLAEASRWAEARGRGAIFRHWPQVILGIGSGYHVTQVLRRTTGPVFLVEPEEEILQAVRRLQCEEWAEFGDRVQPLSRCEDIFQVPRGHLWTNSLCFGGRSAEFHTILGRLTGRRLQDFVAEVAASDELSGCFDRERLAALPPDRWIGIHEVKRCLRPEAVALRTGRIWAALEELVR
jgi:hypothetical protein